MKKKNLLNILIIVFIIVILLCLILLFHNNYNYDTFTNQNRICCFYAYYEKNEQYKNNLKYFLENGILDNVDYYIIINGESTLQIPQRTNITIYKRENKGFDFGAYSYAISNLRGKDYDYYFFINSSVSGPHLKDKSKPWPTHFIELFKHNVKVVGTTINIYMKNTVHDRDLKNIYKRENPFNHVQSMFFCIDKEYFRHLIKINFFNENEINNIANIIDLITIKEIGLSQEALNNGWNINCILPNYKDLDYLKVVKDINPSSVDGDPNYKDAYFGKTIDKYDVIFFKNNRNM